MTGKFVLITTGFNDAFLRGYVFSEKDYALLRRPPYTDAENASNAWFKSLAEKAGTVWERDDYETEQVLGRRGEAQAEGRAGEFVRKFSTGLFTFWYQMTSLANSLLAGVCALGAWVLALLGVGRAWREDQPLWMFLLPGLHLNLLLAILLALGRYSVADHAGAAGGIGLRHRYRAVGVSARRACARSWASGLGRTRAPAAPAWNGAAQPAPYRACRTIAVQRQRLPAAQQLDQHQPAHPRPGEESSAVAEAAGWRYSAPLTTGCA